MTGLTIMTHYSFLLCSVSALLAVLFFFSKLPVVARRFRLLLGLNIFICSASALLHLFYFSEVTGLPQTEQIAEVIGAFPLELRYGYWLITTTMLVAMFPLLMGLDKVGRNLVVLLAGADACMIVAGYFGEKSMTLAGEVTTSSVVFYLFGIAMWLFMVATIFNVLRKLPSSAIPAPLRDALAYMFFLVLLGWTIYPAGYFHTIYFSHDVGVVLREFTFNIGDLVNKVLWGVLIVTAAVKVSESAETNESSSR